MSKNKSIYLVAHNGNNFDHPFIRRYFKEFNMNIPAIELIIKKVQSAIYQDEWGS